MPLLTFSKFRPLGIDTRLARDESGVALIEFSLLLPIFFLLIFGIMEMGQLFWTQTALQHAVEMAARCASVNTTICGTTTQTQSYAATQTYGMSLPTSTFTASAPTCGNLVTASYPFVLQPPIFPVSQINLSAKSCYPK